MIRFVLVVCPFVSNTLFKLISPFGHSLWETNFLDEVAASSKSCDLSIPAAIGVSFVAVAL